VKVVLTTALALALLGPGVAEAARYAVGLERGASPAGVSRALVRATGGSVTTGLLPLRALTLSAAGARGVAGIPGVAWVERLDTSRRMAYAPTDPLAARQWYLAQTRAFDAWAEPPPLAPVLVGVIDSGIDADHPEFAGRRIVAARSFVGGSARTDGIGHGTFVAGIIAAGTNNGIGIAGMAPSAGLIVAKVVRPDRSISVEAEAKAIHWAVDAGARVINFSLGGLRDPRNPERDTYSPLEAAAIDYAYRRGAVLVAAVGNADGAPSRPWPFASYPAALPHVIGVSALARDGSVPSFSDRDKILNDIAAPGDDIFSTLPRALTAARPACVNQGYSDCGPDEYRHAQGTSFAAPQVTAAAAVLRAARPDLRAGQVMNLLTRSATDVGPPLRDALTGWGRLDVTAALAAAESYPLPPADAYETNDDAGGRSRRLWGRRRVIVATVDYWDDQTDVYQVRLRPGERLVLSLRGPTGSKLILWQPGTERVEGFSIDLQRRRIVQSRSHRAAERLAYRAPVGGEGWYFVQVKLQEPGSGPYRLEFSKS